MRYVIYHLPILFRHVSRRGIARLKLPGLEGGSSRWEMRGQILEGGQDF